MSKCQTKTKYLHNFCIDKRYDEWHICNNIPPKSAMGWNNFKIIIKWYFQFLVHFHAIHTSAFLRRQLFPEVFIICFFFLKQFINKNFLASLRRLSENQSLMDHIVFFQNLLSPVVVWVMQNNMPFMEIPKIVNVNFKQH